MKYEIGQKVETPLGVGKIFDISVSGDMFHVELKDGLTKWFWSNYLNPYKTAEEKLLERGFEKQKINHDTFTLEIVLQSVSPYIITFTKKENKGWLYHSNKWINLELSRILTQYLEEIAEWIKKNTYT